MAQGKNKYYVVWNGRRTGVFETWDEASAQVNGYAGARYKAFPTRREAEYALGEPPVEYGRAQKRETGAERWRQLRMLGVEPPILESWAVDAAASSNPGLMEYRCVRTETGEKVFARGPFPEGTSNIGEFLAIVEALMALKKIKSAIPLYSDSRVALRWVRDKKCKTMLAPNELNAPLFKRVARAERWLQKNVYPNPVLKWRTEVWGENPADYGRK